MRNDLEGLAAGDVLVVDSDGAVHAEPGAGGVTVKLDGASWGSTLNLQGSSPFGAPGMIAWRKLAGGEAQALPAAGGFTGADYDGLSQSGDIPTRGASWTAGHCVRVGASGALETVGQGCGTPVADPCAGPTHATSSWMVAPMGRIWARSMEKSAASSGRS